MALDELQTLVLTKLAASPLHRKFYWTGGTLLAEKYLHHRASFDIDLFCDQPFSYADIKSLVKEIITESGLKCKKERIFDRWQFFLHNHHEVKFEFVHYNFSSLKPRRLWKGVLVDSLEDIAANKIMAVVERHAAKDVVDIYGIMRRKRWSMTRLQKFAYKKFGLNMAPSTVLGEILRACRTLSEIKPYLHGTAEEQEKKIREIQKFFERSSTHFMRYVLGR